MKAPAFEYIRAGTVDEAIAALVAHDGGAKVIAGGQSLVPMLNFRLLGPTALVDINGIEDLAGIEETADGGVAIGALTRHRAVLISDVIRARFPVVTEALRHVAHLAIRNRGTIGGSLSHADPAAEWPMLSVLLDAVMTVAGPDGERQVPAQDFFDGALATVLGDDELLVRVTLPGLPAGAHWGFEEYAPRAGDFALGAAAVTFALADGAASNVRVAVMGVDETPLRVAPAEAALEGKALTGDAIAAAAAAVQETVNPPDDLHGSAEYRRHLIGGLVARVIRQALARGAQGEGGSA